MAWYHANKDRAHAKKKACMKANPVEAKVIRRREAVKRLYGLALVEYDSYIGKLCPICEVHETKHLDHCHTTGKIRGGLCNRCNTALGLTNENPTTLRKAADYLEAHSTEKSQQQTSSHQPIIIAVG